MQGFYFSEPIRAPYFSDTLRARRSASVDAA
jgi:hypothetical protein